MWIHQTAALEQVALKPKGREQVRNCKALQGLVQCRYSLGLLAHLLRRWLEPPGTHPNHLLGRWLEP